VKARELFSEHMTLRSFFFVKTSKRHKPNTPYVLKDVGHKLSQRCEEQDSKKSSIALRIIFKEVWHLGV